MILKTKKNKKLLGKNMDNIAYINSLLKERPISPSAIKPDEGQKFCTGQIWETDAKNAEFPFVMILDKIEKNISYNVAPFFRWTEKAGPEDLFVPRHFAGTPMILSFELEFSISKDYLKECKGILGDKELNFLLTARSALENEDLTKLKQYTWGWNYLDEYDNRYQYHEELAAEIEMLQGDLVNAIFQDEGNPIRKGWIFISPSEAPSQQMKLAASGDKYAVSREFTVTGIDNILVVFSEIENSDKYNMYIYDESGNPSSALNKYKLCCQDGQEITIDKNHAEFLQSVFADYLISPSGEHHKLKPKE